MSLSQDTKNRLAVALTSHDAANEVIDALSTSLGSPAGAVAAIGTTTNLAAAVVAPVTMTPAACAGGASPSATNVNTAIDSATAQIKGFLDAKADNVDLETLRTQVEARLDTIEAKVDAIITALKGASLMAP